MSGLEERLIDTLVSDDDWGQREWLDPVGRITAAHHRRRRRRLAAAIAVAASVAVFSAFGIAQLQMRGDAVVRPAGPGDTVVSHSPTPNTEQQQAAAAAAAAAQQAAAAQASAEASAARCPKSPAAITASMADQAFQAVVRYNRRRSQSFNPATLRRDRVTIAAGDNERGGEVTTTCGPFVAARTFVVYTTRTDLLPSQSLSQGVYFVSRAPRQLQVWEQAH